MQPLSPLNPGSLVTLGTFGNSSTDCTAQYSTVQYHGVLSNMSLFLLILTSCKSESSFMLGPLDKKFDGWWVGGGDIAIIASSSSSDFEIDLEIEIEQTLR